jgi:hypothetical protein
MGFAKHSQGQEQMWEGAMILFPTQGELRLLTSVSLAKSRRSENQPSQQNSEGGGPHLCTESVPTHILAWQVSHSSLPKNINTHCWQGYSKTHILPFSGRNGYNVVANNSDFFKCTCQYTR